MHAPAMKRHLRLDLSKIHLRGDPLKVGGARKSTEREHFRTENFSVDPSSSTRLDDSSEKIKLTFVLGFDFELTLLHPNRFFSTRIRPLRQICMVTRYEMASARSSLSRSAILVAKQTRVVYLGESVARPLRHSRRRNV